MAVNQDKKQQTGIETTAGTATRGTKRRRVDEDSATYGATPLSMGSLRGMLANNALWKGLMGLLIFIFAVGFAFTAVAPKQGGSGGVSGGPTRVATVGNQVVERDDYIRVARAQIDQMSQFGMKTGPMELLGSYQRSLDRLIEDAAQYDEAVAKNLTPTQEEIDAEIDKRIKDSIKQGEGENPAAFRRQVEAQYGSMAKFEEEVRKNLGEQREAIAHELAVEKLKKSVEDQNKTTEADYKRSVTKMELFQITVRPKPEPVLSGKDANVSQEKSKADAKARAEKLAQQLKGADLAAFKTAAKKESDDFATKDKGGALGWKLPSEVGVSPPVKEALQNATGKIVGPLEDEWSGGWVIFYINNRKEDLPKDYAKNKAELLKNFETQKDNEVWTKYVEDLKKAKNPEILDPALSAYKIQNEKVFSAPPEQQKTLRQEALEKYEQALTFTSPEESAAIHYQMAQLYRQEGQNDKVIKEMQEAVKAAEDPNLRVQLATALQEAKQEKEALEQLKLASEYLDKNPGSPSPFGGGSPDVGVRMQIASAYEAMGKKDLAEAERKKIPQQPAGGGLGGLGGLGAPGGAPITINPQ